MLTLEQAKDILRIDDTGNDAIIQSLMDTVQGYIELTTGLTIEQQGLIILANNRRKQCKNN